MKLKKLMLAALFASVFLWGTAAANNVSDINIDVTVKNDGSAVIVQHWTGTFNEGMENYIPINTGGIEVSDLAVSDEKGEYEYTDGWDVNAGFDEKARKCGINPTSDGVELCFGISDYGEKAYKIGYTVTDFIKGYSDFDGTNFMLINPGMSTFPTMGTVTLSMENGILLDQNSAGIWAFGFKGDINFSEGKVIAKTSEPLEGDNSMIIMLRLNKGIISPKTSLDKSFEEVKSRAFEGSDYGYDEELTPLEEVLSYIILFGVPALIIFLIFLMFKRRREIKKFYRESQYYRDVPNGGDIEVSYFLSRRFNVAHDESLIIGALMLSMINGGSIEPETAEDVGFFGKTKQTVNLKLVKPPKTAVENRLYNVLVSAAGDDGVLQEKELERYAYKNPKAINSIMDGAEEDGKAQFINRGGAVKNSCRRIKHLTESGKDELSQVMGLKKYLDEFSLISERSVDETIIWQDYMVYAALFGIADKVISQLKKLYPDRIAEFENYNRNVIITHSYYTSMYNSAQRAQQAARTSGAGGASSVGGGGSFSGGGFGGGSR